MCSAERYCAFSARCSASKWWVAMRIEEHQIKVACNRCLEAIVKDEEIHLLLGMGYRSSLPAVWMNRNPCLGTAACKPGGFIAAALCEAGGGCGAVAVAQHA
tara:strand:+ start:53 stop:358 length:306 start_codon:yes stop_codon:yes gene_type:complete